MKFVYITTRRTPDGSPSVWRVWIEMFLPRSNAPPNIASPSVWRVWIEIRQIRAITASIGVTLRVEGVD